MKVHELLTGPEKWIMWSTALDEDGGPVHFSNAKAVCWCLAGAIQHCYPPDEVPDMYLKVARGIRALNDTVFVNMNAIGIIVGWNDDARRTFGDVQKLMKDLDA